MKVVIFSNYVQLGLWLFGKTFLLADKVWNRLWKR